MQKTHKKEDRRGIVRTIKSGLTAASDILISKIFPEVNEEVDTVLDKVEDKMLDLEQRIIQNLTASLMMGFALIAIGLAGFYYLVENIGITKTKAFLVLGAVLLVISFLLKYNNLKTQNKIFQRK